MLIVAGRQRWIRCVLARSSIEQSDLTFEASNVTAIRQRKLVVASALHPSRDGTTKRTEHTRDRAQQRLPDVCSPIPNDLATSAIERSSSITNAIASVLNSLVNDRRDLAAFSITDMVTS